MKKEDLLQHKIEHIDITKHNPVSLIDDMGKMAFQARNINRACHIYDKMLKEKDVVIFLTLAGSLISAGLKKVVVALIENNMVDAIVSTGANIVDQDFFEALGFYHYQGDAAADDNQLREMMIDRIYDTYIDEEDLRICDDTISLICQELQKRPYSSREFIYEMGSYLERNEKYARSRKDSIVYNCFKKDLPVFVPALSDSSAGFGLVHHQFHAGNGPKVSIDSAADFLEITKIKIANKESGICMLGGGVPKNFLQDIVVAAEILGEDVPMHKYAIQITVADERDGGLSGSTLKEASSWGKVETTHEQMVFSEITLAFPLIAGYVYHKGSWKQRKEKKLNKMFEEVS